MSTKTTKVQDKQQQNNKQKIKNKQQKTTEQKQEQKKTTQNIDELKKELENCQKENEQIKDQYTRLLAEFDNYRKRTVKEKMELVKTASEEVISGLLEVLDNFERALASIENTDNIQTLKEGVQLIYKGLKNYLKQKGLEEIDAIGEELNTDYHEAVAQMPVDDEDKKGKIIDIAQKGYILNGKVIRHAKVVIGK